ncbi:hypothetical protein D3C77_736160 [compost metagenome]
MLTSEPPGTDCTSTYWPVAGLSLSSSMVVPLSRLNRLVELTTTCRSAVVLAATVVV